MKKVLFVATLVKNHLMEFHIPYLKLFKEQGWKTLVAAKNDYDDPADCCIPYCDDFYDTPFCRAPLRVGNLKAWWQIRGLLKKEPVELIHCHTPMGGLTARLAAMPHRKRGLKVIYTAHGFHFYKGAPLLNWLMYFTAEWVLAPLTDVLITINQEDYQRAKRLLKAKRIEYIPGVGIDTAAFRGREAQAQALRKELNLPHDATVLLSVGDLNKNKNHMAVLTALSRMEDKNYVYLVCGRGDWKDKLESYAASLGLSDRVRFLGYRDDVVDFYALADLFVFPSFREGLSVSVMEAMASGLPVACSRIRGNTDLVEEGINGFLFDPAQPDTIAAAVRTLADPALRETISRNNREKAAEFDLKKIVERYQRIYDEVTR